MNELGNHENNPLFLATGFRVGSDQRIPSDSNGHRWRNLNHWCNKSQSMLAGRGWVTVRPPVWAPPSWRRRNAIHV